LPHLGKGRDCGSLKGGALMDMSFNLLTQNLTQSFRIVYDDYQALLDKKHYARDLLSLLSLKANKLSVMVGYALPPRI